jgi:hypothetical protein
MLLDHVQEPELSARVLATEQRFRDLSAVAQSEQSSHPLSRNEALRRRVLLLQACEQWARELGQLCLQRIELQDAAMMRSVRETVTRIDASLTRLIDALANQPTVTSTEREPAENLAPFTQHDPRELAVRLLLRIDAALLLLIGRQ